MEDEGEAENILREYLAGDRLSYLIFGKAFLLPKILIVPSTSDEI